MTLKTQIIADLDTFMNSDEFADTAVYTPSGGGDTVSCSVFCDHDVIIQPSGYDAQVVETGSTITALYSDVGEPVSGSTFVVNETTYTVKRITDNDRVFVTMVVVES